MKIAIDPGTNKTGIALFMDNRPKVATLVIKRPNGMSREMAEPVIIHELITLLTVIEDGKNTITDCVVESFVDFAEKKKFRGVRIVEAFASRMCGRLEAYFDDRPVLVKRICKGRIDKGETRLFAKSKHIRTNATQDECDALYIGHIAGFLKE